MRSQIEPAFARLHKNCEIRLLRLLSAASVPPTLVLSSLRFSRFRLPFILFSLPSSISRTPSHSYCFFPNLLRSLFSLHFRIPFVFRVYFFVAPSFRFIFDPSTGRALSRESIFPFPFMDTRWVGIGKDPIQNEVLDARDGTEPGSSSDIFDRLTNSFHLAKDATSACIYIAGSVRYAAR